MVDLSDKGSESEDMSSQNSQTLTPDRVSSEVPQVKTCADCGTTKTPLWRGGPAGPKSLCNACGIRSRKKRRALLGLSKEDKKPKKTATTQNVSQQNKRSFSKGYDSASSNADSTSKYEDTLKRKLFAFGRDVALQRPRSNTTQRRKLGEEEQAAFLLMALSCGSVSA